MVTNRAMGAEVREYIITFWVNKKRWPNFLRARKRGTYYKCPEGNGIVVETCTNINYEGKTSYTVKMLCSMLHNPEWMRKMPSTGKFRHISSVEYGHLENIRSFCESA